MNRVVNALKAPGHRALLTGSARRGFSTGPGPGLALRLLAVLPRSSRIFPLDFLPRQRPICVRKWLIINNRTFRPFSVAVRLPASLIFLQRFHAVAVFSQRGDAEHS